LRTPFEYTSAPDTIKTSIIGTLGQEEHMKKLLAFVAASINVNSDAEETTKRDGKISFNGSKTEIALLTLTKNLGFPYRADRERYTILQMQPFSSERKRMSTLVKVPRDSEFERQLGPFLKIEEGSDTWVFVKGASEIVLDGCTRYLTNEGTLAPMTPEVHALVQQTISEYAQGALRTIVAAMKPYSPSDDDGYDDGSDLILAGLFGILDPLRPEVPEAVKQCQSAGIVVRMVTGDNIATARAIALQCGILSAEGMAMEGPEFRKLTDEQRMEMLPSLQVLARSSPLDKQILVSCLRKMGDIVAVTGDGTNDAPAMAAADVGFSMGIAGTEIAKEASDIVLLDDNFASLVRAVIWGRCVYDSIRKFLQFQLSVNLVIREWQCLCVLYSKDTFYRAR
jgi:P-type Ca2+ transporter type 2C